MALLLLLLPSLVAVVLGVLAALYLSGPLVVVLCATIMILLCFTSVRGGGNDSDIPVLFYIVMPLSCMLVAMMFTGVGMILADHIRSSSSVPSIIGPP